MNNERRQANGRRIYATNTSGYSGVTYETKAKKWRAYFHIGGKKIALGYFPTLEGAITARSNSDLFASKICDGTQIRLLSFFNAISKGELTKDESLRIISYYFYEFFNNGETHSKGLTFCGYVLSKFNYVDHVSDVSRRNYIMTTFYPFQTTDENLLNFINSYQGLYHLSGCNHHDKCQLLTSLKSLSKSFFRQ